ncbi:MAG: preprotein translocase subunit SecE [Candidatus Magasanikbacteria bacterium]|uniref:Protein translocase subunit SecE n=1 Tax=Candidatus Magasanikbacteria bacterium CG10_big_fil_rev_8_21_14_0_10_38_6 TaxID=1974647 RepID=A0A2M6P1M7_9BACT|nr:preprotein translocase subunit SecE [Candidatus Magasanikbacteria bacterium]NCS72021.1 preprotein translocase subunit SecE [Candidatus Magasanikbacteria bacterium]PIR77625.1 MAG: preprotein translocase subunit SecE [Candidatus Magasanikbacteria bacterium CG10_big_fil_rev_8_21_14_0_10_38_6]
MPYSEFAIGHRPFLNTKNHMAIIVKIKDYFNGAISEMKRVVWPSKKETKNYSIIVIVLSLGLAVFFGLIDYIFNFGLSTIIK